MAEQVDHHNTPQVKPYGLLAEFADVDGLLVAARQVREAGYTRWDCCSPFPVHGLDEAMGARPTRLPWLVFLAGLAGAGAAYLLQWYTNAADYPFLISGKPYLSLPANIPVIFELTVLFSALAAALGMLVLNRLPRLYHPLFKNERFGRVTADRFFIVIEAADPRYDPRATAELLRGTNPVAIEELEE